MVLIKHTLLPILGITSFIIFYFGILNFITTENHSIDLEDLAMENIELENVYNMMMIDTVRSQTIKNYLDTKERVWKHNYIENKQSLENIIDAGNYYSTSNVSTEIAEKQKITFEGLKKIEDEIIKKIDDGQMEEALKIINSNVYMQQKDLFTNTLRESLDHHKGVAESLEHNTKQRAEDAHYTAVTMLLFAGVVSAGVMISTVYISGLITKPIEKLELCMKDFSKRNKKPEKDSVKTNIDEVTNLFNHFISMVQTVENTLYLEKKLVEKLKDMDKQKNEFMSMISHELKTPLVPIMGYSELLKNPKMGYLSDKQMDAVNEIFSNSKNLQVLIGDMLTAQKLDMNKLKFKKDDMEVTEFLQSQIMSFEPVVQKKGVRLLVSRNVNCVINSDKNRLGQVFGNLITNAKDFVKENSGIIEIGVFDKSNSVIFYVKDNGIGIPTEKQQKLFKKFYQVDTTITREHAGSGLGLAICKGIVEGLGGKIWLKSEVDEGTIFYFSIPKKSIAVEVES